MSGILFGRITVAGLLSALVVGCSQAESGSAGDARPGPASEVTVTPSPVTPIPVTPEPATPTPVTPDLVTPNPVTPDTAPLTPPPSNPVTPNPVAPSADPEEPRVAWVPPGPSGPYPFKDITARWFEAFGNQDCDAIATLGSKRDQQQLYAGLGDACRAVLEKNDRLWTSAEVALQDVGNPTDCLDRAALRLLRDLVMAHQRAPDADIHIVDPPQGAFCGSANPSPPSTSITPNPTSVTPRPNISHSQRRVPDPGDSTPPPAPSAPAA